MTYTSRNAATSVYKRGTALKSNGTGRRGTPLPCQTYSTSGRKHKTSDRPCGATNRKAGIECAGLTGQGFSLDRPVLTGCTNYQSSNHFAGHIGADLRYYFWGHAFIRPEAHYYVIHHNVEFNNVNVSRFAVSIGYSFMPGF